MSGPDEAACRDVRCARARDVPVERLLDADGRALIWRPTQDRALRSELAQSSGESRGRDVQRPGDLAGRRRTAVAPEKHHDPPVAPGDWAVRGRRHRICADHDLARWTRPPDGCCASFAQSCTPLGCGAIGTLTAGAYVAPALRTSRQAPPPGHLALGDRNSAVAISNYFDGYQRGPLMRGGRHGGEMGATMISRHGLRAFRGLVAVSTPKSEESDANGQVVLELSPPWPDAAIAAFSLASWTLRPANRWPVATSRRSAMAVPPSAGRRSTVTGS